MSDDNISGKVKDFILSEFLPQEEASALTNTTELVTSGVLDSVAVLTLVAFLEDTFDVAIEPHEADVENFNTLADITKLVESKQ